METLDDRDFVTVDGDGYAPVDNDTNFEMPTDEEGLRSVINELNEKDLLETITEQEMGILADARDALQKLFESEREEIIERGYEPVSETEAESVEPKLPRRNGAEHLESYEVTGFAD